MSKLPFEVFDVPREIVDAAYEALRLALEVKGVRRGTNEVTKAVERGIAKLVLIAKDVDPPEVVAHLPYLCKEKKIPFIFIEHKSELGKVVGLDVPAASACIVDPGEGKKFVDEIVSHLKGLGLFQG